MEMHLLLPLHVETAMGVELDENNEMQRRYIAALKEMNILLIYRTIRPWLYSDLMWFLSPMHWKQKYLLKFLHSFSIKVIEDRKSTFQGSVTSKIDDEVFMSKKRLAMLDLLLSAKEDSGAINDEGIQEEVDTFIMEVM